jgi:hypothetical protein
MTRRPRPASNEIGARLAQVDLAIETDGMLLFICEIRTRITPSLESTFKDNAGTGVNIGSDSSIGSDLCKIRL